jgi:hypothetical protein
VDDLPNSSIPFSPLLQAQAPSGNLQFLQADYNNPAKISQDLEHAGVDTLICALGVATPETNQAQRNLIQACNSASTVKRFVISSFDMLHRKEYVQIEVCALHLALMPV